MATKTKVCLYGELNKEVTSVEYEGGESYEGENIISSIDVDNTTRTIYADIYRVPHTLTLTKTGTSNVVFDGSEDKTIDIPITDLSNYYNKTELTTLLGNKENISNKSIVLNSSSTDTQYPSAKTVYDNLQTISTTLSNKYNIVDGITINNDGTLSLPNFDSNGNKLGIVKIKIINGVLTVIN